MPSILCSLTASSGYAKTASAVFLLAMSSGATVAAAEKISIRCEKADVINAAWSSPMTVAYEGEEAGTLTVKAPHGELTLPATLKRQSAAGQEAQVIEGFGMTETTMPDLARLESCITTKVAPGEEANADSYDQALIECLAGTPASPAPVSVKGHVKVGLLPGDTPGNLSVIVEVRRTYDAKTRSPRGSTTVDSFPANCALAGK